MLVALTSLLRHLPRFFRHTPKTPLRVLGIVAFDTLHVLRHSRPLSPGRADALASFMDFEGCANAACDGKPYCEADYRTILTRLDEAGLAECVRSYLQRLRELENGRPAVPGDLRRVMEVRAYREAVARLSMGTAAVIALTADPVDEGSHSTSSDRDVDALYRVLMQCQIIDDVLDYRQDVAAGLPSFLTASVSVPESVEVTREAVGSYAAGGVPAVPGAIFPLRLALAITTMAAKLIVWGAAWRLGRLSYPSMVRVRD
jgi:hypothetical protein